MARPKHTVKPAMTAGCMLGGSIKFDCFPGGGASAAEVAAAAAVLEVATMMLMKRCTAIVKAASDGSRGLGMCH